MDEFKTMLKMATEARQQLVYCDYIAHLIATNTKKNDCEQSKLLLEVGPSRMDLHPQFGHLVSTKRTIEVIDKQNKKYRITVEEL